MRAIRQYAAGGPEVLRLEDVPRPEPALTEVLVRVQAAGVNPVDWWTRAGGGVSEVLGAFPWTVGWDVAGVVEEIGFGVSRFKPGDRVYGMPWFPRMAGAYAEYVTAPSRHLAPMPANLDFVQAAALPLAALTAELNLDVAGVEAGQRVLINAAAGGVGHLAVQIAKARGAFVYGNARAEKHDFLRALGVDEPIDYTLVDPADVARDVDAVVDMIGGTGAVRHIAALRPGGILVGEGGAFDDAVLAAAAGRGVRVRGILVEPDYAALERITALVEAGKLRTEIAAVFPLEEAAQAHILGEQRRTAGKIVLQVA